MFDGLFCSVKISKMAKKRITRVYTKTGDKGETSLVDGKRVSKSSKRVDAFGDVDELNSIIGICRQHVNDEEITDVLNFLQNDLFILGGDLATPSDFKIEIPRINTDMVKKLEELIDKFHEEVGDLKEFILPAGREASPHIHLARTICRRAERKIVGLSGDETVNSSAIVFLNRLSDLLFVLARVVNKRAGFEETFVDFSKK